jgi:hypothetical protein
MSNFKCIYWKGVITNESSDKFQMSDDFDLVVFQIPKIKSEFIKRTDTQLVGKIEKLIQNELINENN